jgi:hypothetical protein
MEANGGVRGKPGVDNTAANRRTTSALAGCGNNALKAVSDAEGFEARGRARFVVRFFPTTRFVADNERFFRAMGPSFEAAKL